MTHKVSFLAFWPGFFIYKNFITELILNYSVTESYEEADILFVGPFVNQYEYDLILTIKCKKILYISEPIEVAWNLAYKLLIENQFDMVFGCINNNLELKYNKYPLYIWYIDINNPSFLNESNTIVKSTTSLDEYRFACLINRHDDGKTRSGIYNKLKTLGQIDCPSILFNNCSNAELENIGNVNYIRKYIFNICPENFKTSLKGYITEKLVLACIGGAIPIYYGSFDEIDEQIFNKDRIIFYDPFDEESLQNTFNLVNDLMQNKEKLLQFYKQSPFQETAHSIITLLQDRLKQNINKKN